MPEYHPPLAGRDALRLDFNENTWAASPKVIARLRQISAASLTKYPEREGVEAITAAHFGLESDQVLLTNGVDEAIHIVCAALLEEDDEALLHAHLLHVRGLSLGMMPAHVRKCRPRPPRLPFRSILLAAIIPRTKLIMVASPNNPTGAVVSRGSSRPLRRRSAGRRPRRRGVLPLPRRDRARRCGPRPQPARRAHLLQGVRHGELTHRHARRPSATDELHAQSQFALQRQRRGARLPARRASRRRLHPWYVDEVEHRPHTNDGRPARARCRLLSQPRQLRADEDRSQAKELVAAMRAAASCSATAPPIPAATATCASPLAYRAQCSARFTP